MIESSLRRQIEPEAAVVDAAAGDVLFQPGDACGNFLLVTSGTVRVEMSTYSGRDLVLYRVSAGEVCAITITCLLAGQRYIARAIADTEVSAMALPQSLFERLVVEQPTFRNDVFAAFSERIQELMSRLEEVLTHGLDPRLARCLLASADDAGNVALTHQRLAVETAAAREAVSRRLKSFEKAGWIELGRGRIRLTDRRSLAVVAEPLEHAGAEGSR